MEVEEGERLLSEYEEKRIEKMEEEVVEEEKIHHHNDYKIQKIVFIFVMFLFSICALGIGLILPQILTQIAEHKHPDYSPNKQQAKASTYQSYWNGLNTALGLISGPLVGAMSDIYGRKKVAVVSLIALTINLVIVEVMYAMKSLWLFSACVVSGYGAINVCAMSYMGDIAKDEKEKATFYGWILGAYMFGAVASSFVLGIVIEKVGLHISMFILIGISVVVLIIFIVAFHEDSPNFRSLHQKKVSWAAYNPFVALKMIFGFNTFVTIMTIVSGINFFSIADGNAGFLYTQNRFGWGAFENGLSGGISGVATIIWLAIGTTLVLKRVSRQTSLTFVLLLSGVVHISKGLASVGWLYLVISAVGAFSPIGFSLTMALVTEKIPKKQQGLAIGGLNVITGLAQLGGSFFASGAFSWCLDKNNKPFTCPATAFYGCGLVLLIGAVICFFLFLKYPPVKDGIAPSHATSVSINNDEEVLVPKDA